MVIIIQARCSEGIENKEAMASRYGLYGPSAGYANVREFTVKSNESSRVLAYRTSK